MKRNLLIFIMLLSMAGLSRAQVLADFEIIPMNGMDPSTYSAIPNPDVNTVTNPSRWVGKMDRVYNGNPWGGFWCSLPVPIDVTDNHYVHVKVWKPRISPIKFKLEGGPSGTQEFNPMNPQTLVDEWEDIVFDVSAFTGAYPIIAFMPDFEDPLTLTENITIYFDDMYVNNDPTPFSDPVIVMEDFEELIDLNIMLGDPAIDMSSMCVVPNPDLVGNESNWVVKFLRDMDGVVWGGFWSRLPEPYDVTTNKFIHVDVWKPRISPVYFKIEGGAAGNLEIPSVYEQTVINAWENYTFDFTEKTGNDYQVIAFMPDKIEPVGLTEDIVIYFDNIVLDNVAPPPPGVEISLSVDMHGSGLLLDEPVYFAGDFGGIYGTWNAPGTNPENELFDLDGDSVYTVVMNLLEGNYQFKFFKGAGWDGGEWNGDPNRKITITGEGDFLYKWGKKPANVTFNLNMKGSGLAGEDVYVAGNFGGIYGTWNTPGDNLNNMLTAVEPLTDSIYTIVMTLDSIGIYQLKFFKGAGWDGGEWTGDPNRVYTIRQDTTFALKWGLKYPEGMNENPLAGKIQTYPNPVMDMLNVVTSTDLTQVVITNMVGQEVIRMDNLGTGKKTIEVSDLSNGMYFITFYGKSGGQLTQKFMKY